jgi:hypothetical protein
MEVDERYERCKAQQCCGKVGVSQKGYPTPDHAKNRFVLLSEATYALHWASDNNFVGGGNVKG